MTNFQSSPLTELMQSNLDELSDCTTTSLFDLINAHKSSKKEHADEDVKSLTDLTSEHLNLKDEENIPNFIESVSDQVKDYDEETSSFSTLEEYARSFLSTNNSSTFLNQKLSLSNAEASSECEIQVSAVSLSEKLSDIRICDPNHKENKKIDLTAALSNPAGTTFVPPSLQPKTQFIKSIFYPVKECIIDISALADENVLYNNKVISNFGYVISKRWKCSKVPKEYRKIIFGRRTKPYNISQSFKFDTPSPDDIALKARIRTTSNSRN